MKLAGLRFRAACVAAGVNVAACGAAASPTATPPVGTRAGDLAPALSGTSIEGHRVSLSALRGSVVVVVFWASSCAPCQAEQPAVNTLAEAESHNGVRFVGVSIDVDAAAAARYVSRFSVPYDSLVDTTETIALGFDIPGPPTTFIIDRRGHVAAELVGELNPDYLRSDITAAEGEA